MKRLAAIARYPMATPLILWGLDAVDRLHGRYQPLVPPRRLIFVGGPLYREVGEEFLGHFIDLGGLRKDDDVLDVGCGIGRMAVPLLDYLDKGTYEGFDIVPLGIAWCRRTITRRNPRFQFRLVDIHNGRYNPSGTVDAATFKFPYENARFDFVFLTSLLTHLLPADAHNYVREAGRVLRPGGRFFATAYVHDVSPQPSFTAKFNFAFEGDGYRSVSADAPEDAIAYTLSAIDGMLAEAALRRQQLHRGTWTGTDGLSLQDILVASKAA